MALSDAVSTAYEAACPPEIFFELDPEEGLDRLALDAELRGNFFLFRARAVAARPEFLFPSVLSRQTLWRLYLDQLREAYASERLLMDIKYNSWHHLDGFWRFPTESPGLIRLVRDSDIPVVHLVRRNVFALYCSLRLAELSNVWQQQSSQPAVLKRLTVNLEDCSRWMAEMAAMQGRFADWFHGHRVHTLMYEGLFEQGHLSADVSRVFTEVFGRPPVRELSTRYTKILPPLHRAVENAGAVLEHFANTEFCGFVTESLVPGPDDGGPSS